MAPMSMKSAIERAIDSVGGDSAFMARLNIKRRSLFYWRQGRLPIEQAIRIEAETGIPRHELRPDVFPAPEKVAAA